jgi:diguanylate cyclase (GGDEF)-like protein
MNSWLKTLQDALNLVEHGVIFLDNSLTVKFINQAYYKMWGLPETGPDRPYTFDDLERNGDRLGVHLLSANDLPAYYVRHRMALVKPGSEPSTHLRLRDGRFIRMESCSFPAGGRLLTYTDETMLIHSVRQMQVLSITDDLTKVYNRRFFYASGQTELERARRYKRPLSVILLHPDNFKALRETHGHAVADEVLVAIAACCRDNVRDSDYVGRLRGEEFAITLIEAPFNGALRVAEKLSKKIGSDPIQTKQGELAVTASFGVATLSDGLVEFSELLRKADAAFGPERGTRDSGGSITPDYDRRSFEPSPLHQYRRVR